MLSYSLTDELQDFFEAIDSVAENYWFVSATERRCLNLVSRFLPRLNNLVSNSGLLLQYKKFADYYVKHSYFPPILIIDDIMVHGRGIAKLLQQLEKLLYDELVRQGYLTQVEERNDFRRMFTHAVDIYIYAKNTEEILLEDRFLLKVTSWKDLSPRELHDLSLQLSDSLTRWEVANTSFVLSVRNRTITNDLLVRYLSDVYYSKDIGIRKKNPWVRIPWRYCNEDMILYICLQGSTHVNRISTVRLFPQREKKASPQLTSFTILGDLSAETIRNYCFAIKSILKKDSFPELHSILSEADTPVLQQSKGQLISFIWSMLDLFNFFDTVMPDQKLDQILPNLSSDINKIACNFGRKLALQSELAAILYSNIRGRLMEVMYPLANLDMSPIQVLYPYIHQGDYRYIVAENANYAQYNTSVERIFHHVGIEAETHAFFHSHKRYLFQPELYQNYGSEASQSSSDGVISFSDYIDRVKNKCNIHDCLYQYLAAYLALMDNGIMGARLFYRQSDNKLITLSKAGEMATFYFPRRFAIFIPAFSRIERRSYRVGLSAQEAIIKFFDDCLEQRGSDYETFFQDDTSPSTWHAFIATLPSKEELIDVIHCMYNCGQRFREWDFENLTYQETELARLYQWFLEKRAMKFLRLPLQEF